jgi:hypothetical protein
VPRDFFLPKLKTLRAKGIDFAFRSWKEFQANWPMTIEQEQKNMAFTIFCSIISDGLECGWSLNGNKMSTYGEVSVEIKRQVVKKILDARVKELQDEFNLKAQLVNMKQKSVAWVKSTSDFESAGDLIQYLQNLYLDPVDDDAKKEIFRYFRHSWRIPYKTTPGRTLSFLVRSKLDDKIVAITSLASPVMWMSNRDEAMGFESFHKEKIPLTKDEQKKFKGKKSRKETRTEWVNRWKNNRLVDSSNNRHNQADNYTVDELITSLKQSLLVRLQQFPLELLLSKSEQNQLSRWGLDLSSTKPTLWDVEPKNTALDKRNIEKRRRIVKKCIESYLELCKLPTGMNVDQLFFKIHHQKPQTFLKALQYGMRERKTSIVAGNLAEMIICGAVPPFNKLRVGKLASMLMFSKELSNTWYETYSKMVSEISSNLSGREITRDSKLLALSTTGLYGSLNVQYDRAKFPHDGRRFGFSKRGVTGETTNGDHVGPSTLTISNRTWDFINRYALENGLLENTSGKFGEGTSARIRRMQSVIRHVMTVLNESSEGEETEEELFDTQMINRIVMNPFSRSVHVGLIPKLGRRVLLGIDTVTNDDLDLLSADEIVSYWSERWLTNYLSKPGNFTKFTEINAMDYLPPYE